MRATILCLTGEGLITLAPGELASLAATVETPGELASLVFFRADKGPLSSLLVQPPEIDGQPIKPALGPFLGLDWRATPEGLIPRDGEDAHLGFSRGGIVRARVSVNVLNRGASPALLNVTASVVIEPFSEAEKEILRREQREERRLFDRVIVAVSEALRSGQRCACEPCRLMLAYLEGTKGGDE